MSSFLAKKSTMSLVKTIGDGANPITLNSVPFHNVNFHILDNDVIYGDGTGMIAIAPTNSVLYFDKSDLKDWYFKNRTAGVVARVALMASVVHPETMRQLERVE